MLSSQVHKRKEQDPRLCVTFSLRQSLLTKLNRRVKQESNDDGMASRSRIVEKILETALR